MDVFLGPKISVAHGLASAPLVKHPLVPSLELPEMLIKETMSHSYCAYMVSRGRFRSARLGINE